MAQEMTEIRCSFCDKPRSELERICVRGTLEKPGVSICNECVDLCARLIESERRRPHAALITYPRDADGREVDP